MLHTPSSLSRGKLSRNEHAGGVHPRAPGMLFQSSGICSSGVAVRGETKTIVKPWVADKDTLPELLHIDIKVLDGTSGFSKR